MNPAYKQSEFEFYIDDRLTYRVTRPMVEHYGNWVFDNPEHVIVNFALGGAYPLKTNGVRSPYPGTTSVGSAAPTEGAPWSAPPSP